jgi:hypothetical protein
MPSHPLRDARPCRISFRGRDKAAGTHAKRQKRNRAKVTPFIPSPFTIPVLLRDVPPAPYTGPRRGGTHVGPPKCRCEGENSLEPRAHTSLDYCAKEYLASLPNFYELHASIQESITILEISCVLT